MSVGKADKEPAMSVSAKTHKVDASSMPFAPGKAGKDMSLGKAGKAMSV